MVPSIWGGMIPPPIPVPLPGMMPPMFPFPGMMVPPPPPAVVAQYVPPPSSMNEVNAEVSLQPDHQLSTVSTTVTSAVQITSTTTSSAAVNIDDKNVYTTPTPTTIPDSQRHELKELNTKDNQTVLTSSSDDDDGGDDNKGRLKAVDMMV